MSIARLLSALAGSVAVALTAACSTPPDDPGSDGAAGDGDRLAVLASVYPLEFVAERVGGERAAVSSLTPAGAEPHDLELSPALVREVGRADVVVHLGGFQHSVDEAIAAREPAHVVDAAPHARLDDRLDPHFWQDPTRLADVAEAVAATLAQADPEGADDYAANAAALVADLTDLDQALSEGLADCASRVVVTTHDAFGYLAERYSLEQVPIAGLDPEAEPSPARLREVAAAVQGKDVTTVFAESQASPRVAESLAADLGLRTAVLDPVETRAGEEDYLGVMNSNLEALREALRCD